MADEQLTVLRQGSEAWNAWREENPDLDIDLFGADLTEAQLAKVNLSRATLSSADLSGATLTRADLTDANLSGAVLSKAWLVGATLYAATLTGASLSRASLTSANLSHAALYGASLTGATLIGARLFGADLSEGDLTEATLSGADLSGAALTRATVINANLSRADLTRTNLSEANLSGADLTKARLVETNFTGADLTGCRVYGISAWNLKLDGAKQKDLIITPHGEPEITVDNLEIAQFIYLLLNNERIRDVIDTITSKVVLILGRFTPERKAVLDALREELRQRDYTPVLFDFDRPASKSLTGTTKTLANMARFVIADLTDPSSVPHELAMVVPTTRVPVQPILVEGQREYSMFVDLKTDYHWVLEPYRYASPERLIADLSEQVIAPAEAKARELRGVSPPTG